MTTPHNGPGQRGGEAKWNRSNRPAWRILLGGGLLPALVVLASVALVRSWRDELPDPVANHWGATGRADGFASLSGVLGFVLGFGLLWIVAGLVVALIAQVSMLAKLMAGAGAGTGSFVAALSALTIAGQRGLTDAAESELATWTVPAAIGLGLVVGVVAAGLVPRWSLDRTAEHGGDPGRPFDLAPTEQVFWARTVTSGKVVFAVLAIAIPGVAASILLWRQWSLIAIALVLLALVAFLASVRVTVDHHGFAVRSVLRWPRMRVSLDQVESATVVPVRALREFGGYGFRVGFAGQAKGAVGFVLRSGDALLIHRHDGARFVVVVDDAHTAAGLLNALVERAA